MKHSTQLSIWAILLWASIVTYNIYWWEAKQDISERLPQKSAEKIQASKQKNMWEILDASTKEANKAEKINPIPNEREELLSFIDKNIDLKRRIQGMSWYRDILMGHINIQDAQRLVRDANLIESQIATNPKLLSSLQDMPTWNAYLQWNLDPHTILNTEIPAIRYMEELQEKNPTIFTRFSNNPIFTRNTEWSLLAFSDQKVNIDIALQTKDFLEKNPEVMEKLAQYWYTIDHIYSNRYDSQGGIYWEQNAVIALMNPRNFSSEVWQQFLSSEKWHLYSSSQISPQEALAYMNELMWRYAR
jgi:hypothetical protein